jgi:hypothetical protein
MDDKLLKRRDKNRINAFSFIAAIYTFLLNKTTEGKLCKIIYFPDRFTSWSMLEK